MIPGFLSLGTCVQFEINIMYCSLQQIEWSDALPVISMNAQGVQQEGNK
jgi:hypothetical protein